MPKQPDAGYITHQAPRGGPVAVHVRADMLELAVVPAAVQAAYVQLAGTGADEAKVSWEKDGWHVNWPAAPRSGGITVRNVRGGTVVQAGDIWGSVTISDGDVVIGGRSVNVRRGQGLVIGQGVMQVNSLSDGIFSSVTLDDGTVIASVSPEEMPRAVLHVPADSQVYALIEYGDVTADGSTGAALALLVYQGHNANVAAHSPVGRLVSQSHNGNLCASGPTGTVQVSTHNGHTVIEQAFGQTTVQSHNGAIEVHAMDSVMVQAVTHNGSVNITKEPGTDPMVQASSYNGSVRKP